jgi:hypothetical protein
MITSRLVVLLLLIWVLALPAPAAMQGQDSRDEQAIQRLVEAMESAVLARDQEEYLAIVDLSDPVFALEHTRWSDEWADDKLVLEFDLEATNIEVDGDEATGDLTMRWRTVGDSGATREAEFVGRFTRDGRDGWRYGGEHWNDTESEHFLVRAAPGLERQAEALIPLLPEIYEHVTTSLDYEPSVRNEIKLYADMTALGATTLLSLPLIQGWNEPGEALKLWPGEGVAASTVAHEFTHFLEFDMSGTAHSRLPWWLSEGLAEYVSSAFWGPGDADRYLAISQDWNATGLLADWEAMTDFETTPLALWNYVYPQGYAFARFITETYGEERRNEWVKAMSVEMDIDEASETVLGATFAELDEAFREWLAED